MLCCTVRSCTVPSVLWFTVPSGLGCAVQTVAVRYKYTAPSYENVLNKKRKHFDKLPFKSDMRLKVPSIIHLNQQSPKRLKTLRINSGALKGTEN